MTGVSIKVADVIRKQPHVAVVSPIVTWLNTSGAVEVIYGIDMNSFQALGGPFQYIEGGPFTGPSQVLVDDYWAAQNNVHAGDTVKMLGHDVTIAGVVMHGKGARKFLPISTLQEWMGSQGKASMFYVKADNPNNADAIMDAIRRVPGMENYTMRSMKQYLSMMTGGNLPGFSVFITVVISVAVIIGFIVIFQAMYTAVMERTREIGILKSLGASRMYIVQIILRETVLLAICGIILGIGISYGAREAIVAAKPTLRVIVPTGWLGWAALIAIAGAILGALYPAVKAARKDPIDALAYE
jgi:putative ABC transport system permease protein